MSLSSQISMQLYHRTRVKYTHFVLPLSHRTSVFLFLKALEGLCHDVPTFVSQTLLQIFCKALNNAFKRTFGWSNHLSTKVVLMIASYLGVSQESIRVPPMWEQEIHF